jgi:tRNA A-37 threonylcarbamoyl transferase component Bud32
MMDLEGRILDGRYQLGSLLGVGGMARVYLASDRVLERQVAVKVLSPPYAQDPVFVERFRREARSAARLSHPNIVAVFDSGSDAGEHYLVMEYVAGQSLAELLAGQGSVAPRRAAELAVEVCAALSAAHAQGLVHRDVKPANVLVGDDGRVKVADFGIVKAATTATLTGTGTVLGTTAYLSPEQAQGGPVDARADLYSLGCLLYELLCGSPPFGSGVDSSPVAVATRHVSEPPEPPSVRNPQVDASLDAVVLTTLAKDPAQRYQSAAELQDALEHALAGNAVAAGPGSPRAAAVPTKPLPGLPGGRTEVLPAAAGEAVRDSGRRPGWPRWALAAAGMALGIGLLAASLWPDDGTTPTRREAGPSAAPATSTSFTTTSRSTTSAPSAPGVESALADLTAVITAARQQSTVDQEAEDLLHQADDLANALQEDPKEDEGVGNAKGEDAAKKVAELERKVDELIGKGKIRPPATTQIQQAVAQLAQAVRAS